MDALQIMAARRFPTVKRPFSAYMADLGLRDVQEEMRRVANTHPSKAVTEFLATAPELEAFRELVRGAAEEVKASSGASAIAKKIVVSEMKSASGGGHGGKSVVGSTSAKRQGRRK